jgi:subtilase family serine protease
MRSARFLALTGAAGLVISIVAAVAGPAGAAPAPHRILLPGSLTPARERAHPVGTAAANSQVRFDLVLKLRDSAGAQRLAQLVSTPGSAGYRHYLSDAAWIARFGPTTSDVAKAESWLRASGFSVLSVPPDRLFIAAQGPAKSVEHAFAIRLGYYTVNG